MRLSLAAAAILVAVAACEGTDAPSGLRPTPLGEGVAISWELTGLGLPRLPFPNDVLTRTDPTAPSGVRVSLARDSRTVFEDDLRAAVNDLDGFSGAGPILIPFDGAIDIGDLRRRQQGTESFSESAFGAHAIYLVDLDTGLPTPLGLGAPWTPDALPRPTGYHPADPRDGEPSLFLETVDEAGTESDYDGVDDVPTTLSGATGSGAELVDDITGEWERESSTLILRPLLPLSSGGHYAVVVTERLRGASGEPVRSPLPFVHPPAQTERLRPLRAHFAAHPELYGDLAERGFLGVAFMWAFTVQTTAEDLSALSRGLDGEGPLSTLASDFPPVSVPHPVSGGLSGRPCPDPGAALYRAPASAFRGALEASAEQLGLGVANRDALIASYDALDGVVAFVFEAPYLLGNPERPSPTGSFSLDRQRGEVRVMRAPVVAIALLPRETTTHRQPFTPLLWAHDAGGSKVDALVWAGLALRHGLAPVFIDAPEHGLSLSNDARVALLNVYGNRCVAPLAEALLAGRAADFDGDGRVDSGAAAHGPDPIHARDLRRQTALDHVALARVLASFDGRLAMDVSLGLPGRREPLLFDGDYDRDGTPDAAGDFDGNGTPDLGGSAMPIVGIGMGADVGALALVTSRIRTASLVAPGGGLAHAFLSSADDKVRGGALFSLTGPVVWTRRSSGPDTSSGCAMGDTSVRLTSADLDRAVDTEVACVSAVDAPPGAVLVVSDFTSGAVGCAVLGDAGLSHVPIEADSGDRWGFAIYPASGGPFDFRTCTTGAADAIPTVTLDTFGVESGAPGLGRCPECARYRLTQYEIGDPLLFPRGGLGRRRQSPGIVRYETLLSMALFGADPLAYVDAIDERILVTATVGDGVLSIASAAHLARAGGVLPFLPPDAPPHLSRWAAAAMPTPHDRLSSLHVLEGAAWLERTPVVGGPRFLVDPDDLSEGSARFAEDGTAVLSGARPVTPMDPVRIPRFTLIYVAPEGAHGPDPARVFSDAPFDASQYLVNHVVRFAATREIRHLDVPMDHLCFADSSCAFLAVTDD
jgi:hypothetical protein